MMYMRSCQAAHATAPERLLHRRHKCRCSFVVVAALVQTRQDIMCALALLVLPQQADGRPADL